MPKPNPQAIRAKILNGGSDEMNMPPVVLPFKGSVGFVFRALDEFLKAKHQPSLLDLQLATGYSQATILSAIQELEGDQIIAVQRPGPRKKNRYRILLGEV